MKEIKALIIDDEALGRQIIREFLEPHPEIRVMAECRDAHEALEAINKYKPDLLFLDIQMPEINGFELLEMLDEIPYVIFSTAYDKYALKAFEVNAVDYLLKPYVQERFDKAVERAKWSINQSLKDSKENIEKLLDSIQSERKFLKRILVKDSGKIIILNTEEILWIEAIEDYVNIHTKNDSYLINNSLQSMEKRLDPELFIRIHRSYIINLNGVEELLVWSGGRLKCRLKDGKEIILSRSGTKKLKKLMI